MCYNRKKLQNGPETIMVKLTKSENNKECTTLEFLNTHYSSKGSIYRICTNYKY